MTAAAIDRVYLSQCVAGTLDFVPPLHRMSTLAPDKFSRCRVLVDMYINRYH
jgi:hypothetical protein